MGAINHYKGSRLAIDETLVVGDFIISPNGLFVGVLEPNGSFAVYWNQLDQVSSPPTSFVGQPAAHIWHSPGDNPGPHFMIMQSDGNLCIYPGSSFQDDAPAIWASDSNRPDGGTYLAVLGNDSALQVKRNGEIIWDSGTRVIEAGPKTCVSGINYHAKDKTTFALSSRPPSGTGTPSQGRASVTVLREQPTDDQIWLRLDCTAHDPETIGHPEVYLGMVLINKQTGLALGSDGAGKTVMTPFVDDNARWDQGDAEYDTPNNRKLAALRLRRDNRFNLNVKGDPPYAAGTEVVLWNWRGAEPNLVWRLEAAPVNTPVQA
jgi:hypothetical protein